MEQLLLDLELFRHGGFVIAGFWAAAIPIIASVAATALTSSGEKGGTIPAIGDSFKSAQFQPPSTTSSGFSSKVGNFISTDRPEQTSGKAKTPQVADPNDLYDEWVRRLSNFNTLMSSVPK